MDDRERVWQLFDAGLGLSPDAADGDQVHLSPAGLPPIEGVVDYVSPSFRGVRTEDSLLRFIHGFDGTVMVGHHLYAEDADKEAAERAWRSWLDDVFVGPGVRPEPTDPP